MRGKTRAKALVRAVIAIAAAILIASCKGFKAGVPAGFVGEWRCEETASDGVTDTGFYAMYVEEDGYFSMYDVAAGNPGISGHMGNDSGTTIECHFDMEDFDVPFCWTIDSSQAELAYELSDDTLKLGHNDVWMTFHREDADAVDDMIPEPLDSLLSFELPSGFELDMEYPYDGTEGNPLVQLAYSGESKGYFAVSIFSYEGWDCLGDVNSTIDVEEYVDALDGARKITIGGETAHLGTRESDDMPDMVAVAYVQHGEYVFEFRLTNYDEQVTEEQMKGFEQILSTVEFTE